MRGNPFLIFSKKISLLLFPPLVARRCIQFLLSEKMRVWTLFPDPAAVKAMLTEQIKVESLRT
jgi:hypothetical protein